VTIQEISPQEACERAKNGWTIIDVRSPGEWSSVHVPQAINIPLDTLSEQAILAQSNGSRRILTICHSGGRSKRACEIIAPWSSFEVASIAGGTSGWKQSGLPVVEGRGVISIERQVRIAAGALVSIGVLAGMIVTPQALYLPLFVGCGLVFAGVTDFCGMGILLSKMPWNR
jgi:rhodanese-related sulfurtransferase